MHVTRLLVLLHTTPLLRHSIALYLPSAVLGVAGAAGKLLVMERSVRSAECRTEEMEWERKGHSRGSRTGRAGPGWGAGPGCWRRRVERRSMMAAVEAERSSRSRRASHRMQSRAGTWAGQGRAGEREGAVGRGGGAPRVVRWPRQCLPQAAGLRLPLPAHHHPHPAGRAGWRGGGVGGGRGPGPGGGGGEGGS